MYLCTKQNPKKLRNANIAQHAIFPISPSEYLGNIDVSKYNVNQFAVVVNEFALPLK